MREPARPVADALAGAETAVSAASSPAPACPRCGRRMASGVHWCFVCGEPVNDSNRPLADFGPDYEVLHDLGQGGMGRLYVVRDRAGREAVLKTMLDPAGLARFRREAEAIGRLSHPNIVTMYLFRPDAPQPYIVMELCRQGNLFHLLERQGRPCDATWFWRVAEALLSALDHAHSHGLVHRDVSPDNVLFAGDEPKLADFGLAADRSRTQITMTGQFMGKLHYAAPEQWENASAVDIRADLFGLGLSMYYAMTGRSPFPALAPALLPDVVRPMIEALTHTDPRDRPADPAAALALLRTLRDGGSPRPVLPDPPVRRSPSTPPIDRCHACEVALATLTVDAPYCPNCGVSQYVPCPGCSTMGRCGQAFCTRCGLPIQRTLDLQRSLADAVQACDDDASLDDCRCALQRLLADPPVKETPSDTVNRPIRALLADAGRWHALLEEIARSPWDTRRVRELVTALRERYPRSARLERTIEELRHCERAAVYPAIEGFTLLGERPFACDNDLQGHLTTSVAVYRWDRLARAIGLGDAESAADVELVLLPIHGSSGQFTMGSPTDEPGRHHFHESPHGVQIAHRFLIARTAVSRRAFAALGSAAGTAHDALAPATGMSWDEAHAWCRAALVDLPSEAEWEYAARGSARTPFCFGTGLAPSHANCDSTVAYGGVPAAPARGGPVSVGSLPPNAFGLHEVHGNVWEWVLDSYESDYRLTPTDGSAHRVPSDSQHVARGGAWNSAAGNCRSAHRRRVAQDFRHVTLGFRPALRLASSD